MEQCAEDYRLALLDLLYFVVAFNSVLMLSADSRSSEFRDLLVQRVSRAIVDNDLDKTLDG
jgi:hypothetical protein